MNTLPAKKHAISKVNVEVVKPAISENVIRGKFVFHQVANTAAKNYVTRTVNVVMIKSVLYQVMAIEGAKADVTVTGNASRGKSVLKQVVTFQPAKKHVPMTVNAGIKSVLQQA